jgi:hypothetical protein
VQELVNNAGLGFGVGDLKRKLQRIAQNAVHESGFRQSSENSLVSAACEYVEL